MLELRRGFSTLVLFIIIIINLHKLFRKKSIVFIQAFSLSHNEQNKKYNIIMARCYISTSFFLHVYLLTFSACMRAARVTVVVPCVCVSVRSFLPPRASRPRNIGTYVFTTTRKNLL